MYGGVYSESYTRKARFLRGGEVMTSGNFRGNHNLLSRGGGGGGVELLNQSHEIGGGGGGGGGGGL